MTLQERMRELRKERKETQRQVADAIGVTDRQYQRFETGVNLPGFENLVGIADHFGVSLDYLMTGAEQEPPRQEAPPVQTVSLPGWHYEYQSSRILFSLPPDPH